MDKGIMLAGNLIVDAVKNIDRYPKKLALAAINSIELACGGILNAVQDFARLDAELPIKVVGCCGNDSNGEFIMDRLKSFPNIDASRVKRAGITSFTDVMTEPTGRTFFTYKSGSDALLGDADFEFEGCGCGILHFSYILLMDGMDAPDAEYGTVLARTLHRAQAAGLATSVDVVSEFGDRFQRLVPPALKYTDYCTVNEFEAEQITGVQLREEESEKLLFGNMQAACRRLKSLGVRRWVTIHCPEGAFGLDEADNYTALPSVNVPRGEIKGTVGAGDAFLSGLLFAAGRGGSHQEALRMAGGVAACSLLEKDSNSGVPRHGQVLKVYDRFGLTPWDN